MNITIRQETPEDYKAVFKLITAAFKEEVYSDHKEQFLVERLRKSDAFIPELSLVAVSQNEIVGHILLTQIQIKNDSNTFPSLALAPVSVLPKYQRKGIGGQLIKKGHEIAKQLGHTSVILLGHEGYYPKFGYQSTYQFDITLPFDVPKENCMAIELIKNSLHKVSGTVTYPKAFFED